ncbi:MAG: riboflavin biosynthesis protein RibF [Actinomycetia bacterium]|nr:riboflavin biosynthesis protein RibF [Actinomycetes bacterium]
MIVARTPEQLEPAERAIAIGTFDGVHRGHRAVIQAAVDTGLRSTVVTFNPHPRTVLGYEVEILSSVERRIELVSDVGPDELLLVEFTLGLSRLSPEEFVQKVLAPLGARVVLAGENFRFGRGREGDVEMLRRLGFEVHAVPLVDGVSSSQIRSLISAGDVRQAAALLGRPFELEGTVVAGDRRGGTLGFPTANLTVDLRAVVPAYGIYAGWTLRHPVAMSIGVNPHYGGIERRIEAHVLDFDGDLYGRQLRIGVWERLRAERAFETEAALVAQITADVEAARRATRPA